MHTILEQIKQLYEMFSSFQTSVPSGSLAHKGNFLRSFHMIALSKTLRIIDSGTPIHKTDSYHLFSTYPTCVGNINVKIANGSLSPIAGK